MSSPRVRTDSRWACILPEVRALRVERLRPRDRRNEQGLGSIESLSIGYVPTMDRADWPTMPSLREVIISSHQRIDGDDFAEWLNRIPRLETLAIPGSAYDFSAISTAIQGSTSLRVLHLPDAGPRLQSLLECWNTLTLPSLIELSCPAVELIDWHALRQFLPQLRGLHLVGQTTPKEFPTLCKAARAIGIYVSLELKKGRVFDEPHGVHQWLG